MRSVCGGLVGMLLVAIVAHPVPYQTVPEAINAASLLGACTAVGIGLDVCHALRRR